MWSSVVVRNFQSLRAVDVELGRFTVVTGPSSSGKSAFMRALRTLASNARGTAWISHGTKRARIAAEVDGTVVALERGGANEGYFTGRAGTPEDNDHAYTKLGGTVPAEVTELLGIAPIEGGQSLHFAGQFDRPYLLDETGAAVARTLGALTNVDVVFAASREANRRRLEASGKLKTRQADLAALVEQAQGFKTLPARAAAQDEAEDALRAAEGTSDRLRRLTDLVERLEIAEGALDRAAAKRTAAAPPDAAELEAAADRLVRFKAAIHAVSATGQVLAQAAKARESAARDVDDLDHELHALLAEAGTCPLCSQSTRNLSRAAA